MGKKKGANPTAMKTETLLVDATVEGRVLTMVEVDPATENPALLDAIRYGHRHSRRHAVARLRFYYVDGEGERSGLSLPLFRFH
jgi:hypothetical protein